MKMTQKQKKEPLRQAPFFEHPLTEKREYTKEELERFFRFLSELVTTSSELCRFLLSFQEPSQGFHSHRENTLPNSLMEEGQALPHLLWTIPQVSESLQISRAKIYQLIAQEGLPVVKFGRTVRISPADLQTWLSQRKERS
jgi:excisionase family DNA binding protein